MKSTLAGLATLISFVTSVSAHGFVTEVLINGKSYPGFDPYNGNYADGITQPWASQQGANADGPAILRFENSLLCQNGAKPARQTAAAPAGSKITFHWNQWPEAHKGPILTYLAECGGDCSAVDNLQLKWFKIEEAGLLDAGQNTWATDLMMKQGDAWNIQLPKNIKSGNYIMRHEMISLESTNSADGVQFYPTCFNLEITGGTGQSNPQGVSLLQAYQRGASGLNVGTKRGDPAVYSYNLPGPSIDGNIGATAYNMVNTGASSNGRQHIYPNANKDPYATSGQQPSYDSSAGKNTYGQQPENKNTAPNYETPQTNNNNNNNGNYNNGTPAPKETPQTGSRTGDANRKHCDDGIQVCREEQARRQQKFKRGSIVARTPQDQSYRLEYCYQKWEVCLYAALGQKQPPLPAANNNGYQQANNNGYQQPASNSNGYEQQASNQGQYGSNSGYQQPQSNPYEYQQSNAGYNSYY
ncbi:hypothetical protein TWF970_009718 [Orbilia oligospora]|uniref:lytic cellulose monooxygenase (C4-dehydrogenating) n=1 Tax=Orbilia oligospora TaxID=2813651 RepID=A0A7C8RH64_ORBOL|nr:hypothetical protein TWF970_009718 [Orbilia oligospora]